MGQVANCTYVLNTINEIWGTNYVPVPGTELQIANCEYLLKMIDKANGGRTSYGTGSYATLQMVDIKAVMDAAWRLRVVGNIFVAVSSGGKIAHSNDGISWTEVTLSGTWQSVAYGNGRWVAVGHGGAIAHSTDGVNWTRITKGSWWNDVAYGNGRWTAVGNAGAMAHSTDGVNWAVITLSSTNWRGIAYGNGRWVAVGSSDGSFGTGGSTITGKIAYSTDGINWTEITTSRIWWKAVAYGHGRFVAVGFDTTSGYGGKIAYSTDGVNWTQITKGSWALTSEGNDIMGWQDVAYGNGKWEAVSIGGMIADSADGVNWTLIDINKNWRGIAYGDGLNTRWVAVGQSGKIAHSINGIINWTEITVGSATWQDVAYGGE